MKATALFTLIALFSLGACSHHKHGSCCKEKESCKRESKSCCKDGEKCERKTEEKKQ